MKIVYLVLYCFLATVSSKSYAFFESRQLDSIPQITIDKDSAKAVIDEVIKTGAVPKAQKVTYVNQVTKYGFKNLFKNYSYNSAMPYASQVDPNAEGYMQDYLQANRSYLLRLKANSQNYFNLIDNIFSQYGLPRELKYLAVIESNLKSQALSWVGARGPWQFMSYTAKDWGLKVNSHIDERTDYYKSTHAAARYLLSLYKDLNDWLLVIAAYNGGPGRVYNAIRKSGSRNFWALQYYLPDESRKHVKKFIATHYIMEAANPVNGYDYASLKYSNDFSADSAKANKPDSNSVKISGKYFATIVARNLSVNIEDFNKLNPGFDAILASGNNYNLRLDQAKLDLFVANKYIILNECVQALLSDVENPGKTTYNRKKLR
ncbi:MAG: lytic transglycosylase domain-containing protein [Ginsengibacter sp.]